MVHRSRASHGRAATAFAPATVANVAVGFDVLGFAFDGPGDRVAVTRDDSSTGVTVERIGGVVPDLPLDPRRNTASVALLSLVAGEALPHGFKLSIEKGIPLGSGMGGSAASAVAAVVAANALLDRPLETRALLPHCLAGEEAASGAPHADNAAPCLFGGLTAVVATDPPEVVSVPVPAGVSCVLVRPHLRIDTRDARQVLPQSVPLADHVKQTMKLSGFLAGCFRGDADLVRRSMADLLVEPVRSRLIPGYAEARKSALGAGALGFGIAGSGPSVFAWVDSPDVARRVEAGVRDAFTARGIAVDAWSGAVRARGAAVVEDA
jgi:homoserine kinase